MRPADGRKPPTTRRFGYWIVSRHADIKGVFEDWRSFSSENAQAPMAVGIQKMVNARVAGVAMTLDPGNGDRSKIVIDASWGVGELLVPGEITPDNYVVDKVMLTPVRSRIAEKREILVPDREADRLVRRAVPPAQRAAPCLMPDELMAVPRLAKAAELGNNSGLVGFSR